MPTLYEAVDLCDRAATVAVPASMVKSTSPSRTLVKRWRMNASSREIGSKPETRFRCEFWRTWYDVSSPEWFAASPGPRPFGVWQGGGERDRPRPQSARGDGRRDSRRALHPAVCADLTRCAQSLFRRREPRSRVCSGARAAHAFPPAAGALGLADAIREANRIRAM